MTKQVTVADLTDAMIEEFRRTCGLSLYLIRMCDRSMDAPGSARTDRARQRICDAINARAGAK